MRTYSQFRPTAHDSHIPLEGREDWIVVEVIRTRDSGCLEESNFNTALQRLGGESDTVEVHRFGHWGPGWYELIIVAPNSGAAKEAARIEQALKEYSILDEDDFSRLEMEESQEVWKHNFCTEDRIDFIRKHRHEFEFHSFADMMGCVRGKYYAGEPSTLLG